ncbi:MAG: hypothetical protein OES64_05650 [Desulfobacteraceae bacterium]|nr:hypothetical protein [Desulfobacteraceae bacterium]MDH3838173.1 hypothetical protein [Desulfobacteraceae bacterium]MDH3881018.1 hypothetical protein [Desulfobacteraceae bacterium]
MEPKTAAGKTTEVICYSCRNGYCLISSANVDSVRAKTEFDY